MTYVETQRTPGASVTPEDHRRIAAESERTGEPPLLLAWPGLARLAGHQTELPDRPQSLVNQGENRHRGWYDRGCPGAATNSPGRARS